MASVNWLEVLGWNEEQLEDLRFVGYSYIKQGKYDIAKTFFEALCVLRPENSYDLQTLGAIYLQLGQNLMALQYIEKSLALQPNDLATQLNRAKALYMLGFRKQGREQAQSLEKTNESTIANQATALLLAYD